MLTIQKNIGQNRGTPRIWFQGEELRRAGMEPRQQYNVEHDESKKTLILRRAENGSRVVSSKEVRGKTLPVIDLNNRALLAMFEGMDCVRVVCTDGAIYIQPTHVEERKANRVANLKADLEAGVISTASISHGGGMMDYAIDSGLQAAGFKTKLMFLNEIREDLVDLCSEHNSHNWDKNILVTSQPMQAIAYDPFVLDRIPQVSLLLAGVPCSGASVAGRASKGTAMPEEHEHVGHLIVSFIALAARLNPAMLCFENVTPYFSSASMAILRTTMNEWGYDLHEKQINAHDFGSLENRKRSVLVAVTHGIEFNWDWVTPSLGNEPKTLAEILEHFPEGHPRWSDMAGLRAKEIADKEKGNSFAMQIVDGESTKVPCLTKGYSKVRSSDPKLASPYGDGKLRQLTASEHCAIKGYKIELLGDASETVKHEILGQGVCCQPFQALAEQGIAESLRRFANRGSQHNQQPTLQASNDESCQLELFA